MTISDQITKTMTSAGLNLIAQALSIYDANLRLVVSNAPFQKMFALPDALVTPGAAFEDTIHHLATRGEYGTIEDLEQFVQERVDQARAFAPHYMERTRANGRTISVEGSPLPQGGWVTVYTDITATKAQEALLHARSDALSAQLVAHTEELSATNRKLAAMITTLEETKRQLTTSEARTQETARMMPAHIAHVDAQGRYTFTNQRLPDILPDRARDILGQHIKDALGPFAYGRIYAALQQAYDGTQAVSEFTDDTSARRVRTAFTPDGSGGVYILSTDITEETQTRVALQQTRKRELAAQVISGLAHDFSNLLTIILGMQARLSNLPDLPEEATALVEGTLSAARRGGILLSSIADLTGPRTVRPAACDPAALLAEVTVLARPTLPEEIAFATTNQVPEGALLLDKGLVIDALLNLILNARDACGPNGEIDLTQRVVHDTWIEWRVSDSGTGFSDTALAQACDPFFTTKGAAGSGLGLSMVYDMTKSAGGDLRLSNRSGRGAYVTLRLPYKRALPKTTGLVLLVEDDSDIRTTVRDMLMDLDFSVIEATSADEATALLADVTDISLVLSDIQLEGEATGLDLAHRIGPQQPIVLMTSLPPDNALFQKAQRTAPVLSKPFELSHLRGVLGSGALAAQ